MSLRYFGTDGVRGRALESPLSLEDLGRWGEAWGEVARSQGLEGLVLGWDPRTSSLPMARAFAGGAASYLPVRVLGMVPTPAVALAASSNPKTWGVMISASHNPPEDNGLKGFDERGEKLDEGMEEALEAAFEAAPGGGPPMDLETDPKGARAYLSRLGCVELPPYFTLVVDCAHGATAPFALEAFRGGSIHWLGTPAEGDRINVGVGSTHLETLQRAVRQFGAQAGVAFDGDGDRCLLVAPDGSVVDGDQMLWLLAQDRIHAGDPPVGVVGTVMSNGGLEQALAAVGVAFRRTPVGDKHLVRELQATGWDLAAEASGHLVQRRVGPSGDGLATALSLIKALLHREPSRRWDWRFEAWPLKLVNLTASKRVPMEACPSLGRAIQALEQSHGDDLRMVIRWSGTEPKLRLMVEARRSEWVEEALQTLESAARKDLEL